MKLYEHQKQTLDNTKQFNRVAFPGYEGIYEIDTHLEWCTQSENIRHSIKLGRYVSNLPNVKGGDACVGN